MEVVVGASTSTSHRMTGAPGILMNLDLVNVNSCVETVFQRKANSDVPNGNWGDRQFLVH